MRKQFIRLSSLFLFIIPLSLSGCKSKKKSGDNNSQTVTPTDDKKTETAVITVVNGTGSGTFNIGESITITATIPADKDFDYWAKNNEIVSEANPYTFIVSESATYTANFKDKINPPAQTATITVINGTGSGTYNVGETATITATIPNNKAFDYWSVNNVKVSEANPYTFTVTESITYTANFKDKTTLTILFQGDSITDNSRSRTNLDDLGGGFASMVAKTIQETYGNQYDFTFINRAHSGWNLIDDWNAGGVDHYQEEFYQYNADIVTILIGYNDIIDYANSGGVTDADFESCYRALLQGLTQRGTQAICMSPFYINESKNSYVSTEFPAKRKIVHDLAEEFGTEYIDMKPYMMQAVEDGAYKMELFGDLTHPWAAGNRIISDLVVDKISKLIDTSYVSPQNLGAYSPLVPSSDNNDDYSNSRAWLATSHGKIEYDDTNFNTRQDFVSTKSLKMTNELYNPEQSNAYVKTLFDFSSEGPKDLTSGTLIVDIKVDNFIPLVSFRAHSELEASGYTEALSTIYTVYLSDTSKAESLGNGWYEVSVNLNAWATEQTNSALSTAIAVDLSASKGESENSRETYGVDGTIDSIMWIDNLRFDLTSGPVDYHAAKESFSPATGLTKTVTAREYNKVYFEFYIDGNDYFNIVILNNWSNGYGYFQLDNNSVGTPYNGVEVIARDDGWKAVTIMFNAVSDNKVFGGSRPETVDMIYIRGSWTTATGFIDHLEFSKDPHPNKDAFVAGESKTITTPSDTYTSVTFSYTITNEGYMNVVILCNWQTGYGYFKLAREGKADTTTGITTTAKGDGWIDVTIDFATATIFGGSKPDTVDMMYIRGAWTTANGYIENVVFHK